MTPVDSEADLKRIADRLGRKVNELVLEKPGLHLVELHLGVPDRTDADRLVHLLAQRLAECGIDFVTMRTHPGEGEACIRDTRFEDRWAK